jgi:hypothetical protein
MCPSLGREFLAVVRLLDAKIIFQSQGNFNPFLRYALVFILVFAFVFVFVVGVLLDGVLWILVKPLDVVECSTLMGVEYLGSHRPNTINARKLLQDFVLFVFENGFCEVLVGRREKSRFKTLTGFFDVTILEVLPDLFWLSVWYRRVDYAVYITLCFILAPIHQSFAASSADLIFLGYAELL